MAGTAVVEAKERDVAGLNLDLQPADGADPEVEAAMEGYGLSVGVGGGPLSPLSGAYLLIVLSEPMSAQHKTKMIQKLRQGKQQTFQFIP